MWITNNCLLVESSFLFNFIWSSPKLVILVIILVFSFFVSKSRFLVSISWLFDISTFLTTFIIIFYKAVTFLIESFSSSLNFSLISRTCLVGSRSSIVFKSIISPNLRRCFSLYLAFKSFIFASFSAASLRYWPYFLSRTYFLKLNNFLK